MRKQTVILIVTFMFSLSCEKDREKEVVTNPLPVDLISPETGAVNQPLNVTLKWKNLDSYSYNYTYDIYMGQSEIDLEIIDSNKLHESSVYDSYECSGLELNTTYYWKVVAKLDGKVTTDNELCMFTTTNTLPSIQFQNTTLVIYPHNHVYDDYNTILHIRLTTTGADSRTDGEYNTQKLVADYDKYGKEGYYIAAKQCYDLDAFGYDDWYLPAIDELDSIYEKSITLSKKTIYWSSTEYDALNAFARDTRANGSSTLSKDSKHNFRCVRKEE